MSSRKISILAAALSADAREAALLAHQQKFSGLLFDAWSTALNIPSLSGTGLREFRHLLASQDVTLVGLRAQIGTKSLGRDADIDRLLSRFDELLHASAELGATTVCLDLGALPEPAEEVKPAAAISKELAGLILLPDPMPTPKVSDVIPADAAEVARVYEAMTAFGAVADRYRVTVAFSCSLSSLASLNATLNPVACPWFGVDLDAIAIARDRWPIDEAFSHLGPRVHHVLVRDATLGTGGRTRPASVGDGSVSWNTLLGALDASDYSGWLTIDPLEVSDRTNAIRKARHVLERTQV